MITPAMLDALTIQMRNGMKMAGADLPDYVAQALDLLQRSIDRWSAEMKAKEESSVKGR